MMAAAAADDNEDIEPFISDAFISKRIFESTCSPQIYSFSVVVLTEKINP